MQKLKRIFVLLLSVILVFSCTLTAFADWRDLMISTDSNVRTFALPRSSIESVTNTIDASGVQFYVYYNDASTGAKNVLKYGNITLKNGRFEFSMVLDEGDEIVQYGFQLKSASLPSPGDYTFSFDIGSDFSLDYSKCNLYFVHENKNASNQTNTIRVYPDTLSGDVYLSPMEIKLNSLYRMNITMYIDSTLGNAVGGDVAFNFTVADVGSDAFVTPGSNTSTNDYQSGVSSGLSDISSSVGEMSDEISGVTEAIQNLQGAMEPHYNNVLTQLHHITEQLHAFYDQVYNNIHLAQMNLLGQIKTAIENIDIEVDVNLNSLKTSINDMSTAVQNKLGTVQTGITNKLSSVQTGITNKLQSVGDHITGGYDNSSIQSENEELAGALNEYDEAEKEVLEDVTGYIDGFEYPSMESLSGGLLGAIAFFGGYLQGMFLSMGEFGLSITFSLTMIFVLIIVGYHRIRT